MTVQAQPIAELDALGHNPTPHHALEREDLGPTLRGMSARRWSCSVQEKALLCIVDNPIQPFCQVPVGNGAARQDVPMMGLDGVQAQSLCAA